jgi:hypothetical protein
MRHTCVRMRLEEGKPSPPARAAAGGTLGRRRPRRGWSARGRGWRRGSHCRWPEAPSPPARGDAGRTLGRGGDGEGEGNGEGGGDGQEEARVLF